MLTPYRRHTAKCLRDNKRKSWDTKDLSKCYCPIWVMGKAPSGVYYNRTLSTATLEVAYEYITKLEKGEAVTVKQNRLSINQGFAEYTKHCLKMGIMQEQSVTANLMPLQNSLNAFLQKHNPSVAALEELTNQIIESWIHTWQAERFDRPLSQNTLSIKISVLKRLFATAFKKGWISTDPTESIITPKHETGGKTLPFDLGSELPAIMTAAWNWEEGQTTYSNSTLWRKHPRSLTGLIYLLRYTGLRISDAFKFQPATLQKRVFHGVECYCYFAKEQKKTKQPVWIPLPTKIAQPILDAPPFSAKYPFWDGKTKPTVWAQGLRNSCWPALEVISGVPNINAHRFRDTFAVDLLSSGADIRSVSRLLGHKSITTTLNYYEHYLPSDQEKLVAAVLKGA